MVFSGLFSSGNGRNRHREHHERGRRPSPSSALSQASSSTSEASPSLGKQGASADADSPLMLLHEFIHDEAQLPCVPPDRPDLSELNGSLEALAAVFPDIQIEVFRELLANFDGESRLALVADALLKSRVTWVKGRWKVANDHGDNNARNQDDQDAGVDAATIVPRSELFRSHEYRQAVQTLAWHEFKGLSRSTVNAVLAESNYSYLEARRTLVALSSKSWRFTLSTFFLLRKPVTSGEAENHPLVVWRSSGQGSIYPAIRATGHPELDRELFHRLIVPLKRRDRENREATDHDLAVQYNNEEAEAADAVHECACCFTSGPFEEFTQCNRDGHMLCFRCIQLSIKEAIFGQGWLSTINQETSTLKCLAVDGGGCTGHVTYDHIQRAMLQEKKGAEILHKLDQRLAEHSLLASNLPLIRCPFCSYAEIDEIYMPPDKVRYRIRASSFFNLIVLILAVALSPLMLPLMALSTVVCLVLTTEQTFNGYLASQWRSALGRHRRRRHGQRFSCLNPECLRTSCLLCHKTWKDVHVCNESSLVALRTQIEQAMSMAVKRVCPRCNTSFVKNAGCNKLTCPCGYKMCYVCRADLSDEGYRHFCDHFRPDGDPRPCLECDRCNLWESEDTDKVLREAREEAESRWAASEKRGLSSSDKAFLSTGVATRRKEVGVDNIMSPGRIPTIAQIFDLVAETIFA